MKIILPCCILFFLIACQSDYNKTVSRNNDIVLLINDIPENWKLEEKNGQYVHSGKYEIAYSTGGILMDYFSPNYSNMLDTLIIKNVKDPIELRHKYKGISFFEYIIQAPDTIEIFYKKGKPILKSRTNRNEFINYDYLLEKKINNGKLANFIKFRKPYHFLHKEYGYPKSEIEFKEFLEQYRSKYKVLCLDDFKNEAVLLDSLKMNKLISNLAYNYYKKRLSFKRKILDLEILDSIHFENIYQNDSLLKFAFYRDYIDLSLKKSVSSKLPFLKTKNSNNKDPKAVFDAVIINPVLTKRSKEYLLFDIMESIINTCSSNEIKSYFKRFKSLDVEPKLISYLDKEYKIDVPISEDLDLMDYSGKLISFSQALDRNNGKIIYVDFWASWCAPCIRAMPFSNELREYFKGDEIVFFYLALNDKKERWGEASKKLGLGQYEYNYFITNSKTNQFIE